MVSVKIDKQLQTISNPLTFEATLKYNISALQTLKSAEPENWQIRNNLGVCHFHQMNIVDSTKEFESCLQSQILSTGVPHDVIYLFEV